MKANELRIGNLIGFNYGNRKTYSTITEITSIDVKLNDGFAELSQLEPIPLTEKWLLRFGFEKAVLFDTILYLSGTEWHLSFHENIYQLNYKESPSAPWIPLYKGLKNVHQLQNLYFALTGEELKLKDDENN